MGVSALYTPHGVFVKKKWNSLPSVYPGCISLIPKTQRPANADRWVFHGAPGMGNNQVVKDHYALGSRKR